MKGAGRHAGAFAFIHPATTERRAYASTGAGAGAAFLARLAGLRVAFFATFFAPFLAAFFAAFFTTRLAPFFVAFFATRLAPFFAAYEGR